MSDSGNNHHIIERFERWWIVFSGALIAVFVVLLFYAVYMHSDHMGHAEARAPVDEIMAQEIFASPGLTELDDNRYRLAMVAQAFSFQPGDVTVPAGVPIEFHLTSRDVIHGLQVPGTGINVELIPGEHVSLRYTFKKPGDYTVVCNQYCGVAHHNMLGRIRVVEDFGETAPVETAEVAVDEAPHADTDWMERGQQVYERNCVACHQDSGEGMAGTFPPLRGHMSRLIAAEGGRDYLVDMVLHGISGPIEVAGQTYRGAMPGSAQLSDEDLAALLNYTLHAWDNAEQLPEDFEPYRAEEIEARRGQGLSPADVHERRQALPLDQ